MNDTIRLIEEDDWQRVQAVIRYTGCHSVNQFAKRIGIPRAECLYRIKRGQNRLSYNMADRIIEHIPEISKGWLLSGEGPMFYDCIWR